MGFSSFVNNKVPGGARTVFALVLLLITLLVILLVVGGNNKTNDKPGGPERVTAGQAYDWAASRLPSFFWLGSPRGDEQLRIDRRQAPGKQPSTAIGYLLPSAVKLSAKDPLAFSYLVQSAQEPAKLLERISSSAKKAAVLKATSSKWVAYGLPVNKKNKKKILSIVVIPRQGNIIGRVVNVSPDQSPAAARELLKRLQFVTP